MEKALTLKEVAELLGLSYSTIFGHRHEIGFRLPGSRVWRVWPADLEKLRPREKPPSPVIDPLTSYAIPVDRGSVRTAVARDFEKELDRLLAHQTKKR